MMGGSVCLVAVLHDGPSSFHSLLPGCISLNPSLLFHSLPLTLPFSSFLAIFSVAVFASLGVGLFVVQAGVGMLRVVDWYEGGGDEEKYAC